MLGTFDIPEGEEGGVVEFTAWLHEGYGLEYFSATLDDRNPPPLRRFGIDHPYSADAIGIDYFEIEGPFASEDCEGNASQPPSYQALFGDLPTKRWTPKSGLKHPERLHIPDLTADKHGLDDPFAYPKDLMMVVSEEPEKDARRLLTSFMERAYRRPVEESELERCLAFATEAIARKACFQDVMRPAFTAALCSPDFLYFTESPAKLDGYALASRLSYFLWRSMPDEALIAAAEAGELTEEGDSFTDIHELRKYLLSKEDKIAENLVQRLLTFATGAGITFADREEVSRILKATEPSGHGLRSIIKEIVTGGTFLSK